MSGLTPLQRFEGLSNELPLPLFRRLGSHVIWHAIDGKYERVSKPDVDAVILDQVSTCSNEQALADIKRQWACMKSIEQTFRFCNLTIDLLDEVYRQLYGTCSPERRTQPLLLQDGITRTIGADQIPQQLELLVPLLSLANSLDGTALLSLRLNLAAQILAELIRIHPYPDGNGRASRMAVNLLFRKWSLPYIAIPKVRNSQAWQTVLQDAMTESSSAATDYLGDLLNESLNLVLEFISENSGASDVA